MAQFEVLRNDNTRYTLDRALCCNGRWSPEDDEGAGPGEKQPTDPLRGPEILVDQCRRSWDLLKKLARESSRYVATSVLGLVRSHYPRVDLRRLEDGWAADTSEEGLQALQRSWWSTAIAITNKIELLRE